MISTVFLNILKNNENKKNKNTRKENLAFKMNVKIFHKILRIGSWRRKYIVAWDVRKNTIYGL
jgi:hypothetical protein